MAECLVNVDKEVALLLGSANSGNAPGKFTKRMLGAAGGRMLREVAFCKANGSWNWDPAVYPLAFPHFALYAYVKSICFVLVQAKTPAVDSESEGYFALMFGIAKPRVLNLDQFRLFMQNKRPQDACVLLEGFSESVTISASSGQYCHFAHHIELARCDLSASSSSRKSRSESCDMVQSSGDEDGDECKDWVLEMRVAAWTPSSITGTLDPVSRVRQTRRLLQKSWSIPMVRVFYQPRVCTLYPSFVSSPLGPHRRRALWGSSVGASLSTQRSYAILRYSDRSTQRSVTMQMVQIFECHGGSCACCCGSCVCVCVYLCVCVATTKSFFGIFRWQQGVSPS